MTTVASGRCTPAPAPVDTAIGTNPSAATSAGSHPDQRRLADGGGRGQAVFPFQFSDVGHQHHAVQHRDPDQSDEADARRDR